MGFDPAPVTPRRAPAPRLIPVYEVVEEAVQKTDNTIILDEDVPLADAAKTGDISLLWAAISAASLGGMTLLGTKRKEEDI